MIRTNETVNDNPTSSHQRTRGSDITSNLYSHRPTIVPYGNVFTEQKVGSVIVGILKQFFNGCWPTWRKVPEANRQMMWERFQRTYKWDPHLNDKVKINWEPILGKRYRDFMGEARDESIKMARSKGVILGDDYSVLKPFYPEWCDGKSWAAMIDSLWNTAAWKKMSSSNKRNRCTLIDGQISGHSGGSRSFVHHMLHMEEENDGPVSGVDFYAKLHTSNKETSRDSLRTTSQGESSGSASRRFVTRKAENILGNYKELALEKFGPNKDDHPLQIDRDLWTKACGGMKKGALFGMSDEVLLSGKSGMPSSSTSDMPDMGQPTTAKVQMLKEKIMKQESEAEKSAARVAELEERVLKKEEQLQKMSEQVAILTKAWQERFPSPPN